MKEPRVKIIETKDGSSTLKLEGMDETYHSIHGAVQEAKHVFIAKGLEYMAAQKRELEILEIGFGTGLNCLLSIQYAIKNNLKIRYTGIEAFPLDKDLLEKLSWANDESVGQERLFEQLHNAPWGKDFEIDKDIILRKEEIRLQDMSTIPAQYDLVYFDAFGPVHQDEMWKIEGFKTLYDSMKLGAVFVTYCAKGQVRRDLQSIGFVMERLEGPPGKREMLRGIKP